jgi:hypothetical protein
LKYIFSLEGVIRVYHGDGRLPHIRPLMDPDVYGTVRFTS